jgi:hypothetical protein
MRLRPGLRVLRRGPHGVQIGTDPRWAVVVDDLTAAEADALTTLGPAGDLGTLAARGVDPRRAARLAAQLDRAGLTVHARTRPRPPGPAVAEATITALLGLGDVVGARSTRCVGVMGLGPVGLAIASTLAAAGVGTVLLDDARPVRSADVAPGGYGWGDVGATRDAVATRRLRDVAPDVALTGGTPDVVVVVDLDVADPEQAPRLLASGVAHLSVVEREGDVVVGPLVVPGAAVCLRCLDLHRADLDPRWPDLAPQLADAVDDGGPAAARAGAGGVLAVAAVSAGIAAAGVLAHLDGGRSPLRGATYEVVAPYALPLRREWAAHPSCGCAAPPSRIGVPAAVSVSAD